LDTGKDGQRNPETDSGLVGSLGGDGSMIAKDTERMKFEYKILSINHLSPLSEREATLNAAGAEGWQVVGVVSLAIEHVIYLQRPRETVQPASDGTVLLEAE
jgi:hypothetical protein